MSEFFRVFRPGYVWEVDELSPQLLGSKPGEMTILLSEDPPEPKEDCGYVRAEDVNGSDAMDILRSLI